MALAVLAFTVVPSTVATYQSLWLLATHREAETLKVLGASVCVLAGLLAAIFGTGLAAAAIATLRQTLRTDRVKRRQAAAAVSIG